MRPLQLSIFIIGLLFAGTGIASIEVQCEVREERLGAFSIERSVQFATGMELNRATGTFQFDSFEAYALLWFDYGEVAILELGPLETVLGIGTTFDVRSLETMFRIRGSRTFVQVNGRGDRSYEITCKKYGRWVDPRL